MTLLAQNVRGYHNLVRLINGCYLRDRDHNRHGDDRNHTRASRDQSTPLPHHLTLEDLAIYNEGLILLTGGIDGSLGYLLRYPGQLTAGDHLTSLMTLFPGRIYMELMRHQGEGMIPDLEAKWEASFIDLAYRLDLPLVATNDCYFLDQDSYQDHSALLCIARGEYLSDFQSPLTTDHHFRSPETMKELFSDLPEAIDNTLVIARRCSFLMEAQKVTLPPFPTPEGQTQARTPPHHRPPRITPPPSTARARCRR